MSWDGVGCDGVSGLSHPGVLDALCPASLMAAAFYYLAVERAACDVLVFCILSY